MCRDARHARWPRRLSASRAGRGFSIVSAIFLLVVLSVLGALMVNLVSVQATTSMQDIQGSRAYQASRAGIEWGIYQVVKNGSCPATSSVGPLSGALSTFSVTVVCASTAISEVNTSATAIWTITSTASAGNAGQPDRVERQIKVTVER
jgi:MSHA biogenesis protein MshP